MSQQMYQEASTLQARLTRRARTVRIGMALALPFVLEAVFTALYFAGLMTLAAMLILMALAFIVIPLAGLLVLPWMADIRHLDTLVHLPHDPTLSEREAPEVPVS